MYAHNGEVVTFVAGFTASGAAATGLTVTCKVWELRTDGSKVPDDTVGTTETVAEVGGGAYCSQHTMTGDGVPLAVFSTAGVADLTAIQTCALTIARLDDEITSREASGAATAAVGTLNDFDPATESVVASNMVAEAPSIADLPTTTKLTDAIAALAHVDAAPDVSAIATNAAKVAALVETAGGHDRFSAVALEAAPVTPAAPTPDAVADEVQTRTIAHVTLVDTVTELTEDVSAGGGTPAGYTRITNATHDTGGTDLGLLEAGTVIYAYAVADTDYATPIAGPETAASNGTWHIDVPDTATYTLRCLLAGHATVTGTVTVA